MRASIRSWPLLPVLFLLLTGCATFFPPVDPRPVEEIAAQAEELIYRKAYAGAAELYAAAIVKQPDNGRYYLRRSELLEALGRDKEARANYRAGLSKAPQGSPEHLEAMHRLALLSAEHLQDIDTAEDLLEQLPTGSVPASISPGISTTRPTSPNWRSKCSTRRWRPPRTPIRRPSCFITPPWSTMP